MSNETAKKVGSAILYGAAKALIYYIFILVVIVMTTMFGLAMYLMWAMGLFFCLVIDIMILPFRLRRTFLSVKYGGTFGAVNRMVTKCFKTLCH